MYPAIFWGEKLRSLRREHHLLQKEVAHILRISRQSYSQIETGRVQPSPEQLAVLSNIYSTDLLNYVLKCFPSEYVEEQSNYRALLERNHYNPDARAEISYLFEKAPSEPESEQTGDPTSRIRKKRTLLRETEADLTEDISDPEESDPDF